MALRPTRIVSEYDQEIPQSQTADNPVAPRGRAAQPGRQIKQSNQLSLPHQDDCNTRMIFTSCTLYLAASYTCKCYIVDGNGAYAHGYLSIR